jgi:hypothetical protein
MRDLKILAFISGHKVIIVNVVILYISHLLHSINVTAAQYLLKKQQVTKIRNKDGLVEYKSIEFICSLYKLHRPKPRMHNQQKNTFCFQYNCKYEYTN